MPERTSTTSSIAARRHPAFVVWLALAAVLVVCDQSSKYWFDTSYAYGQRVAVLPFFDFTLLYNPGAAFSFLADGQGWQRWLFSVIALAVVVLILFLLRKHPGQTLFCSALTLVLGGAVGNLIDRVHYGHVVDFLLFYWKSWHFPAFNVADIAISCGAVLLILDEGRRWQRARHRVRQAKAADTDTF